MNNEKKELGHKIGELFAVLVICCLSALAVVGTIKLIAEIFAL